MNKSIAYIKEYDVDGKFPFYFFLEFMHKGETWVSHYRYGGQYFLDAIDDYAREYFDKHGNIPEDIVAHVDDELWEPLVEQMNELIDELNKADEL